MESKESLAAPQSHHHHHQHPQPQPQGSYMGAPPPNNNSYTTATHNNNYSVSSAMISPNSIQNPRFPFNSSDPISNNSHQQYAAADGSSPSSGFRAGGFSIEQARKKRGRPRKYSPSPDGNNIALGLAPAPASVSAGPITPISSNVGHKVDPTDDGSEPSSKKNRGRPPGTGKKQLDALGAPGVGFTPHVVMVKPGEDIASTIMAFSQQGPRTICILSASGAICNVTLRQPAMSGGTVTYEGRFEIISLSGSYLLSESNGSRSRTGGLSVSLAGSDGRVLGGVVAGILMAATAVQVIVGSFIADGKKPKSGPSLTPTPNMLNFSGGAVPGISPDSEGVSSHSSDESGSSPLHRLPGTSYNNASQPIQSLPMYTNMGWPNNNLNMLPN